MSFRAHQCRQVFETTDLADRAHVGQSLCMQGRHYINGVGRDAMVLHVQAHEHVFLSGHLDQFSDVLKTEVRIDQQTKGGWLDAEVCIQIMRLDGLHHPNVFFEKKIGFIHG